MNSPPQRNLAALIIFGSLGLSIASTGLSQTTGSKSSEVEKNYTRPSRAFEKESKDSQDPSKLEKNYERPSRAFEKESQDRPKPTIYGYQTISNATGLKKAAGKAFSLGKVRLGSQAGQVFCTAKGGELGCAIRDNRGQTLATSVKLTTQGKKELVLFGPSKALSQKEGGRHIEGDMGVAIVFPGSSKFKLMKNISSALGNTDKASSLGSLKPLNLNSKIVDELFQRKAK